MLLALSWAGASAADQIYINDPQIKTQAEAVDTALKAGDVSKVYDEQLANLKAITAVEDSAVAARGVADRDQEFARLVSENDPQLSRDLAARACGRLNYLAAANGGPNECDRIAADPKLSKLVAAFPNGFSSSQSRQLQAEATRDVYLATYHRLYPDDASHYDCDALLKGLPASAPAELQVAHDQCANIAAEVQLRVDLVGDLGLQPKSRLQGALDAAVQQSQPAGLPDPKLAEIRQQLAAAQAAAKGGDVEALASFRKNVEAALKDLKGAAKVVGWKTLASDLDTQLSSALCFDQAAPAAAGAAPPANAAAAAGKPSPAPSCPSFTPTSGGGRAEAIWSMLQALAVAGQASDPKYRSASWIAAARAVTAQEAADAELIAQSEKAAATRSSMRAADMLGEASRLARAYRELQPSLGPPADCPVARSACALTDYLASWNEGRIQVEVLDGRELQGARELVVSRQQSASAEQRAVILAASSSLKAYGEGGIQPDTVAQLLATLGLTAVTAAK
jgi:hypothetical protein